jgi:hypothetical protein
MPGIAGFNGSGATAPPALILADGSPPTRNCFSADSQGRMGDAAK